MGEAFHEVWTNDHLCFNEISKDTSSTGLNIRKVKHEFCMNRVMTFTAIDKVYI
jgi:hypothetical protein